MIPGLDERAIVRGLRALGVPEAKAEACARGSRPAVPRQQQPVIDAPISLPVRICLPWSLLVSENARYGVVDGAMILRREYRAAKAAIAERARESVGDVAPIASPVELRAAVFVPDRRPHDVVNFAKLVHDALEKVVYANDRWIYRAVWEWAGVDVDAPRAEITIAPRADAHPSAA
jgi:Holliday junction resolvase RusA-like endonuclease